MRNPILNPAVYASLTALIAVGVFGAAQLAPGQEIAAPETPPAIVADDPSADDGNAQPLEQGPIHEAFASPVGDFGAAEKPLSDTVVDKEPPAPINELVPEEKPEGSNVQWIPGYWMWSIDREDFVWVSGVWRDTPPRRQWTPGSWVQVEGGFAWSPGFWADAEATQVAYLPPPPPSLEEGPSSPAPSAQHFWSPGCWVYGGQNYSWRPGSWRSVQPGWVWVPSYYNRTPNGYLYVNGYWDLPFANRGVLYAPVYWQSANFYGRPGYSYRPRSVVNLGLVLSSLFISPNRGQYYYGSYGPQYRNQNLYPWFGYANSQPRHYDPLFSYYRAGGHRGGGHSFADLRRDYDRFDSNHDRPGADGPRGDRADRGNPGNRGPRGLDPSSLIAASVADLKGDSKGPSMRKIDDASRQQIDARVEQLRNFREQRAKTEASTSAAAAIGRGQGSQAADGSRAGRGQGSLADRLGANSQNGQATPNGQSPNGRLPNGRVDSEAIRRQVLRMPLDSRSGVQPNATPANNGANSEVEGRAGRQGRGDWQPQRQGQSQGQPNFRGLNSAPGQNGGQDFRRGNRGVDILGATPNRTTPNVYTPGGANPARSYYRGAVPPVPGSSRAPGAVPPSINRGGPNGFRTPGANAPNRSAAPSGVPQFNPGAGRGGRPSGFTPPSRGGAGPVSPGGGGGGFKSGGAGGGGNRGRGK